MKILCLGRSALLCIMISTFSLPIAVYAADIQSEASGAWSQTSTWVGDAVPGVGDRAIINHLVTVDANTDVGTSPAENGPAAIEVNPGGALTVAPNVILTVRGDVVLDSADLTLNAGSVFEFSGSVNYLLRVGKAHATDVSQMSRLLLNGSSGNWCEVRSVGTGVGAITDVGAAETPPAPEPAYVNAGLVTGSYCRFIRLGDENIPAISTYPYSEWSEFSLTDVTFDQGGMIETTSSAGGHVIFQNVTFTNTQSSQALFLKFENVPIAVARVLDGNIFDQEVILYPASDAQITNNYFARGLSATLATSSSGTHGWALLSGNLIRNRGDASFEHINLTGDSSGNYWLYDPADPDSHENPHFVEPLGGLPNITIDGDIFEYTGSDGQGDCIMAIDPGTPITLAILNSIVLPNSAGENSGTLFTALGGPKFQMIAEHNTYFTGSQGAAVGEFYAGHPGMLGSFKNNLAWDSSGRGDLLYHQPPGDAVVDLVRSTDADFNAAYNVGDKYSGLLFSSGAAGQNDLPGNQNPQFVDDSRNVAKWDSILGGAGTVAGALQGIANRSAGYTIQALIKYVRDGFEPQNTLYHGAGHNGYTIGAVQLDGTPAPVPTPTPQPTATSTPVNTPTAPPGSTSTPTPQPTATGGPVNTPTAAPTSTPISEPTVVPPDERPRLELLKRGVRVYLPLLGENARARVILSPRNGTRVIRNTRRYMVRFAKLQPGRYVVRYKFIGKEIQTSALAKGKLSFQIGKR